MSDTPDTLMKRAQELHYAKQFREATEVYKRIVNEFADSPQAKQAARQIENIAPTLSHRGPGAPPQPCTVCQTGKTSTAFQVCDTCAGQLGVIPLPEARRPPVPCARCQGRRFVRVVPRNYIAYARGDQRVTIHQRGTPMTLTERPDITKRLLFEGNFVGGMNPALGLGTVEAYVCTACGFIDWYCQDPKSIPIGHEYNTELVEYPEPESPYR